jgi:hypothetical protein
MRNLIVVGLISSSLAACGTVNPYAGAPLPYGGVVVQEVTRLKGELPRTVSNVTIAHSKRSQRVDVAYPVGSPHYAPNLSDFAGNNDGSGF